MAYLVAADFRAGSLTDPTNGLVLGTDEANGGISDANLTAKIATMSGLFDKYVGDHFEPEAGATLVVDGEDSPHLWMPKRIRAITSINVAYSGGATVLVPSTTYTFEVFASDFSQIDHESKISLWPGMYLWSTGWPMGDSNVTVVGDFSWAACPNEVKRAVALMCWESVRPIGDYLRFADTVQMDGGIVNAGKGPISRIPEAQELADFFKRKGRG